MNKDLKSPFFHLLRVGLGTAKADEGNLVGFDALMNDAGAWEQLYKMGCEQGVAAIQFDGLQKLIGGGGLPSHLQPSRDVKMKWFGHTVLVEKRCKVQYQLSAELAAKLAGQGIRTVVLKGIAVGLNYPDPLRRPCGDLDCYLMGDYEKGNVLAETLGAHVEYEFYKHSEFSYKGLMVENHQFCTAVRGSRRAKRFERLLQSLLHDEGTTKIGETSLDNPSPMFNALFLTHHAKGHFLVEGIALRHLCDWGMFVHRHCEDLDWGKFNSYCIQYGLQYFADSMTRLSRDLLGIVVPDGYKLENDAERDASLFYEMLCSWQQKTQMSVWQERMQILRNISANHKRYKLFSDTSFSREGLRLIYGFLFDRRPKI